MNPSRHEKQSKPDGVTENGNYLYRTIRPEEVIEQGLTAKNPNAQYSLTAHVLML